IYILRYHREMFDRINGLLFVLFFVLAYSYLIYAVDSTEVLSAYIIPFAIVPIVIKIFYSDWLALFTHLVIILIASFISSLGYEFTILQLLAGIVAILSNSDTRNWSGFFRTMIFIYFTYALAYIGLSLMQEGGVSLDDGYFFVWIFLNAFLTLLAYPLVPLLERLFGFTSSISLMELSDMNRPLLRELAIKAPGTLQHSLQVANLSEAAADRIGADALLVKVAALYHDIGKTANPEYFIENQSGYNPHDELDHLSSAKMIIGHVTEGLKLAKKARLPKVLLRFIETHHGTTRVEYFYRNFIKENPEREFDESIFRYPGPKPLSKEETILMIADSLEAASKSLKTPTGQDIDQLVNKIIEGKIAHGQLDDSTLTFAELELCRDVFRQRLRSMNHVRVEYPEEQKK
ncbi:MAG: HDIG domain-containing metalloprotein, partial [Bacteroidota bacterium]